MAGVLRHTMVLRNPETLEATALLEGSELPEWAKDLVHADNLGGKAAKAESTGGDDKGYAGQGVDELKALADERELTVTGTGKDGNVLKGDLVAALEADDAAQAS